MLPTSTNHPTTDPTARAIQPRTAVAPTRLNDSSKRQVGSLVAEREPGKPVECLCRDLEGQRGLHIPAELFAIIESALRHHQGLGIEEHRDRLARIYSSFSDIAAADAALLESMTREEFCGRVIEVFRDGRFALPAA